VYVGARREFGFLTAGDVHYNSLLSPEADHKFGDITTTLATPDFVFFVSSTHLIRWNRRTNAVFRLASNLGRDGHAFLAGNTLYVHSNFGGLRHLNGDSLEAVPGADRFNGKHIYCGSQREGKLLVAGDDGMYLQEGKSFKRFPTEADALLLDAQPHSCKARPGGGWAVATDNEGAILLSQDGKLERIVDERSGLFGDQVSFAYPDREGGLWLAMVYGVARADVPSPLSFFDKSTGLRGVVSAITRHDDVLYAGTSAGLFRIKPGEPGRPARFELVEQLRDTAVSSLLSTRSG